jgi:sulfate/thiosulfate transport system ATP-binding protein
LGSLIRIELVENGQPAFKKPIYAEMPNERFKQLQLGRGDQVAVKIRNARWFH